jgi:2-polyprenyl-3-methyl-5-hydroxy-6-metoxy-1,4-benzoquinol methylase
MTTLKLTKENPARHDERKMEVKQPGFFGKIKWATMRVMLNTGGRLSKGVRVGYKFGFDSGNMLDYVYLNKAHGAVLIGKLIDRVYLNAVGWRGIRARRKLLKQMLRHEVSRNRYEERNTKLLDVAAGPGRYLQELIQEYNGETGDINVLCRDLSSTGLEQGQALAKENGLTGTISYEPGDAFNPAPADDTLGGTPNVIVVSGLYELIIDDDTIRNSLKRLYQMLTPGGAIFFTTQTHHPQLEFIANVLPNRDGVPWVMKCRTAEQVEQWAREAGFNQVESRLEEEGLFSVTTGRK